MKTTEKLDAEIARHEAHLAHLRKERDIARKLISPGDTIYCGVKRRLVTQIYSAGMKVVLIDLKNGTQGGVYETLDRLNKDVDSPDCVYTREPRVERDAR